MAVNSVFWSTNFFVFPSGAYTNKSDGLPKREQATYSCPCEKHGFAKFNPHNCSDCPCALLMVIENASCGGNCNHLNSIGISVRIISMRGNSISTPLNFPVKIVASMILFTTFFTESLVLLQSRGEIDISILFWVE